MYHSSQWSGPPGGLDHCRELSKDEEFDNWEKPPIAHEPLVRKRRPGCARRYCGRELNLKAFGWVKMTNDGRDARELLQRTIAQRKDDWYTMWLNNEKS
jgi:hypothetical protein